MVRGKFGEERPGHRSGDRMVCPRDAGWNKGKKLQSHREGVSLDSGRKKIVVGLKWKGVGFLLYPVSNWIALEVENNNLNECVLYYFSMIKAEQKYYSQTFWVCVFRN